MSPQPISAKPRPSRVRAAASVVGLLGLFFLLLIGLTWFLVRHMSTVVQERIAYVQQATRSAERTELLAMAAALENSIQAAEISQSFLDQVTVVPTKVELWTLESGEPAGYQITVQVSRAALASAPGEGGQGLKSVECELLLRGEVQSWTASPDPIVFELPQPLQPGESAQAVGRIPTRDPSSLFARSLSQGLSPVWKLRPFRQASESMPLCGVLPWEAKQEIEQKKVRLNSIRRRLVPAAPVEQSLPNAPED